jgi:hypothetical protein
MSLPPGISVRPTAIAAPAPISIAKSVVMNANTSELPTASRKVALVNSRI